MKSRLVLIFHPDDGFRRELCDRVHPLPVVEARTRQEAVEVLGRVRPMFVVMHHEGARRTLRDIDRHAPGTIRVVLCPDDLASRKELLEVAEGLEFTTVPTKDLGRLPVALQIRTSARLVPLRKIEARFSVAGRALTGAVLELGNDGLSLALSHEAPVELLQPGTTLDVHGAFDGGGQPVLEPRSWRVCELSHEATGAARLGVAFERPVESLGGRIAAEDPIRIGALTWRAARRGARFTLKGLRDEGPWVFTSAELDPAFESVALFGPVPPFGGGDIVQLSFELSGRVYSGLAVVAATTSRGVSVVLPRTLKLAHRRHSLRICPTGEHRAVLSWTSPLTGEAGEKDLVSLHPRGAAFLFDASREVFPDGMALESASISLGGRTFPVRARVQSSSVASPTRPTTRRCGLTLELASTEARQVLLDALIAVRQSEVVDGSQVALEELWQLFEASTVHFPDYPPGPGPHLATLASARAALGDGRAGLGKSLVWRGPERVEAHCGGLRIYRNNWFTQHLVVRPGYHRHSHVSEQMVNLMVDYAEALDDVQYLSAFWRSENRFMARVCGAVARKLAGTGMVAISSFTRLRRARPPTLAEGPAARDADARDLEALLAHARATREPLWLRSKDLVPGELELETLAGRYGRSGLIRRRQIGAAADGRGWALLEEMTPGLFWAELHNGFRLVLAEPDAPDADTVRQALLRWVAAQLLRRPRQIAECLAEPGDVALLERLGFDNLGGAIDLTLHREVGRQWSEELLTMFERFHSPRGERRARGPQA